MREGGRERKGGEGMEGGWEDGARKVRGREGGRKGGEREGGEREGGRAQEEAHFGKECDR